MGDDELIVNIHKDFWPKGVLRSLTPALRSLGDKHGNLVMAAQPAKGQIMVRGEPSDIESVKPALIALIQEYFPEAPLPEALGGGGADEGMQEEEAYEEDAPMEGEAPPAAAPAPAAAASQGIAGRFVAALTGKSKGAPPPPEPTGQPEPPVQARRLRASFAAPPDLIWECVKKHSSFTRKPCKEMRKSFSAEPGNLMGVQAQMFSGLAATEVLDVRKVANGVKESIELVQSHAKMSRLRRPKSAIVTTGLNKCPRKGLRRLGREMDAKFYRRGLYTLARLKYMKIKESFKTKKHPAKSRRAPKA